MTTQRNALKKMNLYQKSVGMELDPGHGIDSVAISYKM